MLSIAELVCFFLKCALKRTKDSEGNGRKVKKENLSTREVQWDASPRVLAPRSPGSRGALPRPRSTEPVHARFRDLRAGLPSSWLPSLSAICRSACGAPVSMTPGLSPTALDPSPEQTQVVVQTCHTPSVIFRTKRIAFSSVTQHKCITLWFRIM